MSSTPRPDAGQAALPFEVEAAPRRTPTRDRAAKARVVHRLDAPACGWPAGTELVAMPRRRLARGDVVVAEELADPGRRLVGVHQVRFGRPFLLTDREAIWLGPGVAVLGVVTVVSPPLPETEALQAEVALAGAGSGRRQAGD